ncbi:MAG: VOC family protein [Pontibacterium sp.]
MQLALDHFFILTDEPKKAGDALVALGLTESFSREHPGQGTANRRFVFANGMLELLYIRDAHEAEQGPAKGLKLTQRLANTAHSPFGLVLVRSQGDEHERPFAGWSYQPDYFPAPKAFYVGDNANDLTEPLCIYVPFAAPKTAAPKAAGPKTAAPKSATNKPVTPTNSGEAAWLSQLNVTVATPQLSVVASMTSKAYGVSLTTGPTHLAELTLNDGAKGEKHDLRPLLPLVIHC